MTAAKKMGIQIPESIKAMQDPTEKANAVLALLRDHFGGSAAAAAGTFGGKLEGIKAQGTNLAAQLGTDLIPLIEKLMDVVSKVVGWLEKHKGVATALGIALAALVIGITAVTVALWAMSLTPASIIIALIVIGVALLIVGIILLVKHWRTVWDDIKRIVNVAWQFIDGIIRAIVHGFVTAWNKVKEAFAAVIEWIKTHWQLILAIITGPIGLAVLWIKDHWKQILEFFEEIMGKVVTFFTGLPGKIAKAVVNFWNTAFAEVMKVGEWIYTNIELPIINFFKSIPGKVAGAVVGFWNSAWGEIKEIWHWLEDNVAGPIKSWFLGLPGKVKDAIVEGFQTAGGWGKNIINWIIDGLNAAIHFVNSTMDKTPLVGKFIPNIPDIPSLAAGGIVSSPTLALIGEAGPEAVIPLTGRNGAGSIGTTANYFTFNVVSNDPQAVVNALRTYIQRNGSLANAGVA